MTNTEELIRLIDEKGIKKKRICEELGISYKLLREKVNNNKPFTAEEIQKFCKMLEISSLKQKEHVFFAINVDKNSTKFDE